LKAANHALASISMTKRPLDNVEKLDNGINIYNDKDSDPLHISRMKNAAFHRPSLFKYKQSRVCVDDGLHMPIPLKSAGTTSTSTQVPTTSHQRTEKQSTAFLTH